MTPREFHLQSAVSFEAREIESALDGFPQYCGGCDTCIGIMGYDFVKLEARHGRHVIELYRLRRSRGADE